MKILHIHPSMAGGGCEAIICSLANEMVKTQDVSVCSIFKPKDTDVFWFKLNTDIKKYTLGKQNKGFSIKEIWAVYRLIKKEKFDIVYLHGFIQYYLLAVILLCRRVKFCYTVHSDAFKENVGWSKKLFKIKRFLFAHKWIVPITISNASQNSFTNLYNCSSELIFNGVAKPKIKIEASELIQKYRYTPKTKILIHPGRITEAKNQLVLCKTIKHLIDDGEDVVLLIAGANQDQQIFDSIEPYFNDRIVYLGERNDIPNLMSYSDALCLPSIWEGLPVVLLEALSVGCVPICSPVGGIVDVVKSGVNGLLSESSDENDFYNVMKKFISLSIEDVKDMQQRCLQSFELYDIINTAREYIRVASQK